MSEHKKLFAAFPLVTPEAWIQQAIKDLKGASFEGLSYTTVEGISIKPFYTAEDLASLPECRPLFAHTDWEVCEDIQVSDEAAANALALHALSNGATSLHFYLAATADLNQLLHEISLPHIRVQFSVSGDVHAFHNALRSYTDNKGWEWNQLNLAIENDFISRALKYGREQNNDAADFDQWTRLLQNTEPQTTLCVDASIYHNAGAPPAYQLACTLAHLHAYISHCSDQGIPVETWANRMQISLAAGTDYFFEIAKFRALRKLTALLFDAYGIQHQPYIHAITASRTLTVYDAYNNLLRTTSAAMAAVIGGCNSLSVTPFDSTFTTENDFSRRMARNIQLILKHESHFDKIADSAAGSYFIESLTEQIAAKAWDEFRKIEAAGGFLTAIRNGSIQRAIAEFAKQEQEEFIAGKTILVGTNKYPNATERMIDKVSVPVISESATGNHWDIEPLVTERLAARLEQKRLAEEKQQA